MPKIGGVREKTHEYMADCPECGVPWDASADTPRCETCTTILIFMGKLPRPRQRASKTQKE